MLIQFRVENHRSLRDEATLSLTAAGDDQDPRLLRAESLGEALLPAIAIYGSNASGKSNVLSGLAFFRDAVLGSYRRWEPDSGTPIEPFGLSAKRTEPSLFEADLMIAGVRHRYGVVLSGKRVEEEWLFAWPNGHRQMWVEREGDAFEFGRNFKGENEAIRKLTRGNSLFLSTAAQNNHRALIPLFLWFQRVVVAGVDRRRAALRINLPWVAEHFSRQLAFFPDDGRAEREVILGLLRAADTGIIDVRLDERAGDDTPLRGNPRRGTQLSFRHKSENANDPETWLPLEVQSAGTIALIDLAPRLNQALRFGGLVCVDELEASLHPMLALSLLELFQDPKQNVGQGQLVFTTHDTNLLGTILGESPLRRDQVWFTEKDQAGASCLYPLTDFSPRKSENLERGYLQGRYGAIPYLGDLSVPAFPAAEVDQSNAL